MKSWVRITLKALGLYLVFNLLFGLWAEPGLGRISAYNGLFPGRPRFPFGETPQKAYSFSLFDLDAMFASHEVAAQAHENEFRVFVLGDSSVWGTLLRPEETLAGQLNRLRLRTLSGQPVRFYNLGYPTISLTKDLLLLDRSLAYQPDMVVWLVTLEAFPVEKQNSVPLVENNPRAAKDLLKRYMLGSLPANNLEEPGILEQTIIGRRKALADLLRLQLYGILWASTGIDQYYPDDYERAQVDLEADTNFHGKAALARADLAMNVLAAGQSALGSTPLLLVNEPILISTGANSDIRYNFYYPRKPYDQYRSLLREEASSQGWEYLDAWDLVPVSQFTNSAIHLNQAGTARLVDQVARKVSELISIGSTK